VFTPISGRSVIVTGGTKGIGKGIAGVFASAGAHVVVVGRDAATGEAAVRDLAGRDGRVTYAQGDVRRAEDCRRVVAEAVERNGGLDVVCANAGIFPTAALAEMSEADIDEIFACNVKGAMLTVQAAIEPLAASGRGRVVLTSSITGPITGFPGWSHYGASKAAMLGFMRSAAIELARRGITVNAVLPGNIATEGLADMGDEYLRSMEASIPQGRLGSVEEVGHACLYLASEEAAYLTGQTIVIDGGQIVLESLAALEGI
jgi:3-oxoacyl-[acyl-carrier protein] reductase